METKAIHVQIFGKVQGVWFRRWTAEQAARLNLEGWVRNMPDGQVEAVFNGPAEDVDTMIELCWVGPRWASVSAVSTTPEEIFTGQGFRVLR